MLKNIKSPNDIKNFDKHELNALADELRETIIDTVARNGGHLSSNLGIVELSIALNRVLDYPNDRIIYDVGHQIYAHKLLTGRYDRFGSLRRQGGLCGFASIEEDPTDSFTTGHASTSISAALGMCRARDLKGEKRTVVAVIGDGAMTGGMSYEALNDAGDSGTDLIVVLNDNEMSISRNVGALSMHLTVIRRSKAYSLFKSRTRSVLEHVPLIGKPVFRAVEKIRDTLKTLVLGENMFEAMGFKYIGPVDGHNIQKLEKALRLARDAGGCVLIHAVTRKGKGYAPAEKEPDKFHGPGPFNVATGMALHASEPGCGVFAARTLSEMADKDRRICAVTAAMPSGTGFIEFARNHPDRCFDVGIAEEHAVTMAAGLAASGMRPYVAIYSTFLQRAYDQIANDVCLNRLPVTFLLDRAGLVGPDGMTHNGVLDISYLRSLPGMTVVAPRDARYLRRVLEWSAGYGAPLAVRYTKDLIDLGDAFDSCEPVVPGKWELLIEGEVMLVATGAMVQVAMLAGMELHARGVSAGIVDAAFIKPMDIEMLSSLARSARLIVTIEENTVSGGFGEGVAAELAAMGAKTDLLMLGTPDAPVKHATRQEQLAACGLDAVSIAASVLEKLQKLQTL